MVEICSHVRREIVGLNPKRPVSDIACFDNKRKRCDARNEGG